MSIKYRQLTVGDIVQALFRLDTKTPVLVGDIETGAYKPLCSLSVFDDEEEQEAGDQVRGLERDVQPAHLSAAAVGSSGAARPRVPLRVLPSG